jgi:putative MATE family efflux protein
LTDRPPKKLAPGFVPAFTHGAVMRHVLVMTGTGLVGLIALFIVDFLNLFYIARLGDPVLSAAVGYCGAVLFFLVSIGIGITIAATALTAREIGAGDRERAREIAGSSTLFMIIVMTAITVVLWPLLGSAVSLLGATGRTHEVAVGFLRIAITGIPILGLGMALSGILRAVGDARRAMYVTLIAGISLAALDPIFIFGLHMGLTGAAIATVISRFVLAAVGLYGAVYVHNMIRWPSVTRAMADAPVVLTIALPAILTNLATPVANAFATSTVAQFGDSAVAGWTVVDRVVPLAFGGIFALSGSVGPILAQNFGAHRHDRVRRTISDSMLLTCVYILAVWVLLIFLQDHIVTLFNLKSDGATIVHLFCSYTAGTFIFLGALFVANAAFNNLGFAMLSTTFNWGRATLGTIPFAYFGAHYGGPIGVAIGVALGMLIFGSAALVACYRVIGQLASKDTAVNAVAA